MGHLLFVTSAWSAERPRGQANCNLPSILPGPFKRETEVRPCFF